MTMKRKWIVISIAIVLVTALLSGCLSPEKQLIGKWINQDTTPDIVFMENGKCITYYGLGFTMNGEWHVEGSYIYLMDGITNEKMLFRIEGNKMLLGDNNYIKEHS